MDPDAEKHLADRLDRLECLCHIQGCETSALLELLRVALPGIAPAIDQTFAAVRRTLFHRTMEELEHIDPAKAALFQQLADDHSRTHPLDYPPD